jgi:thiosulfate/3-mercaptopyruvate sulfurtransferase
MSNGQQQWLVGTDWLASHLDTPVVILDGSMHLPTAKRNARAEYPPSTSPAPFLRHRRHRR